MDIAGLSTALAQTKTQNDVGVLMLSKSLDLTETLGEGMVEILDASAMDGCGSRGRGCAVGFCEVILDGGKSYGLQQYPGSYGANAYDSVKPYGDRGYGTGTGEV